MQRACGWLFLGLLLVAGCDSSEPEAEAPQSAIGLDQGTASTYRWIVNEIDTTTGLATFLFQDDFVVRVAGTGETVGGMQDLIRVEATSVMDPSQSSESWYRETSTQLIEVANRNAGATPIVALKQGLVGPWPLPSLLHPTRLPERRSLARTDSIIIRDEPRIVLQLPLASGARWTAFTTPFQQTRQVIGLDTVTVQAGTFSCMKIRTEASDFAPNLDWVDCVSPAGLITRMIENDAPAVGGLIRVREELALISGND